MPLTVRTRTARHKGADQSPGTSAEGRPNRYNGPSRSPWSRVSSGLTGGVSEQLENRYREPGSSGYSGGSGYNGPTRTGVVGAGKQPGLSAAYGGGAPQAPTWSPATGPMMTDHFPQLNPIGQRTAETATSRLLGESPGTGALHNAQQQLGGPSAASQYWQGAQGKFAYTPGQNRAAQSYDDYRAQRPDFQNDPGLSQYYDLAEKRATNKLNKEFAARGAYGSSVSQGQIGSAVAGLEAEKASREADYRLRNIAEQRAWATGQGELGRAADVTDLGQAQQGLSTLLGGAQAASAADNAEQGRLGLSGQLALGETAADTQRLAAAAGVALPAEQISLNEQNSAFDNLSGVAGQLSGTVGNYISRLTASDQELLQNVVNGTMTADQALQIFAQNHTQQEMSDFAGIVGAVGSIVGMGAGG